MKIFIPLILLVLLLTLNNASSAPSLAKVSKVHGHATKLLPGAKHATEVKLGDLLYEDTSILTEKGSFVRVLFNDKATLNIGPNSKTVIRKLEEGEGNFISLLKGKLRAEVTKKNGKDIKMVVKTRTAALGVRGTDFQGVYNVENKVTSLVTFDGEVAMKKINEREMIKDVAKKKITRSEVAQIVEKEISKNPENFFEAKETVVVKKGRYSGVSPSMEQTIEPVKIAPKQFVALKENTTLGAEKNVNVDVSEEKIQEVANEVNEIKDVAEPTVKSGGLVDLETALYVPPSADAEFNEELKVYETDAKMGDVDVTTGAYVAPAGLELTPEGFVVDKDSKENQKELHAMKEDLNESVKETIDLKKTEDPAIIDLEAEAKKEEDKKERKAWWKPEEFILSFSIAPTGHTTNVKAKSTWVSPPSPPSTVEGEQEIKSTSGSTFEFIFGQKWNEKWETYIGFADRKFEYEEENIGCPDCEEDDSYSRHFIGVKYHYSPKLTFYFQPTMEDIPIIMYMPGDAFTASNYHPEMMEFEEIRTGVDWNFYFGKHWDFSAQGGLMFVNSMTEEHGDSYWNDKWEFESAVGVNLGIDATYKFRKNMDFIFFVKSSNMDLKAKRYGSDGTNSQTSEFEFNINEGSVGLNFVWRL